MHPRIKQVVELLEHPSNRSAKTKAFFRYIAWNIGRRLIPDARFAIEIAPGAEVVVSNHENYATLVYLCKLYDHEEMHFLLRYLRPGDVFGDFGSNVGVYSALASSRGAATLSVEPVPSTYARLLSNLSLNRATGRAFNLGLSDSKGELSFTTDKGGLNRVATRLDLQLTRVPVTTVDDLVQEAGIVPSVVKIDVEGYELPLIRGARDTLERHVCAVVIELNSSGAIYGFPDSAVHASLVELGFGCFRYDPDSCKLTPMADYRKDSFNTLYIKLDKAAAVQARLQQREAAPTS